MDGAREFYIRSLRGLAGLLSDINTAKSDEALATAICLSVFEKHNCTTPSSWLRHAKGIETLMQLRGPGAHIHGFGRSMYIVYRNFLVTAAMISGEACFLEEPEWQALNEQIVSDNAKQPDSLAYTEVAERGFREVTKIPGYVKRVRDLLVLPQKKQSKLRKPLLLSILGTRAALRGIHTEFGVSISMVRAGHGHKEDFIGPLPQYFFDGFSRHSIRGIRSGMLILNYLVILLDPKQRTEIEAENEILSDGIRSDSLPATPEPTAPLSPPSTPGKPKLLIQSLIGPDTKQPPTTDWMDRIVTTMGMDGVRVSLLG
ncbi:hypothetical protein AWENTII_005213 [Aspergillus wentii]|nr:hypothetical protein MW887_008733 [Aspergillus wentii]